MDQTQTKQYSITEQNQTMPKTGTIQRNKNNGNCIDNARNTSFANISRLPIVKCPQKIEDLLRLTLIDKRDVVIAIENINTNISNLMIGVKNLLRFVKKASNRIYYADCIRSTSQSHSQNLRKSAKGANYGIFFFPPAVAGNTRRMFRSRWKNTFLEEGERVTYMISERLACKIDEGNVFLPDVVLGKPMFLLYEKHMRVAMGRLQKSKRPKRSEKRTQYLKTLAHVASTFVRE